MVGEPGIVGRPGDAEDRGPDASGELNGDRTDTAGCTRDRHRIPGYESHRPHGGIRGDARHVQRTGHLPRHRGGPWCQLTRRHGHDSAWLDRRSENPMTSSPSETTDIGTEFDHHPRQVAALTGGKRQRPKVVQCAAPLHRFADIDAGCPDLDQNLTGSRNRARQVSHLEDVNAAVRIELHCSGHESPPAAMPGLPSPRNSQADARTSPDHGDRGLAASGSRQVEDGRVSVQSTIRRRPANNQMPSCLMNSSR